MQGAELCAGPGGVVGNDGGTSVVEWMCGTMTCGAVQAAGLERDMCAGLKVRDGWTPVQAARLRDCDCAVNSVWTHLWRPRYRQVLNMRPKIEQAWVQTDHCGGTSKCAGAGIAGRGGLMIGAR
jgi:hypothetical protein